MSSERFCPTYNTYAKNLLTYFVNKGAELYTKAFVCFNVHCLIHLADDVKSLGPCHSFSAYPFENELGKIKRKLRKAHKPLQQIENRIAEDQNQPLLAKPQLLEHEVKAIKEH